MLVNASGDPCPFGLWCTATEGRAQVHKNYQLDDHLDVWRKSALETMDIAICCQLLQGR